MPTFYIQQFGCRATQADGAAIERQLLDRGCTRAPEAAVADVVVINTCTVTAAADAQARDAIRKIHAHNPGARLIVTGCYAQREPEELAILPGVSWVVGNSHKPQIPELIEKGVTAARPRTHEDAFVPASALDTDLLSLLHAPAKILTSNIFEHTSLLAAPILGGEANHTRPILKIQDGCNSRCSYCVIPFVRGKSRSLPPDQVIAEIRRLTAQALLPVTATPATESCSAPSGAWVAPPEANQAPQTPAAREIVLSGINLGTYGRDLSPRVEFIDLLRRILDETPLERLRVSSIEPLDVSEDLIALFASTDRVAQHFHMPLQSGSDRILAAMHRWYRAEHYARRVALVREQLPHAAIGADVIAGFPGETQADHDATLAFIERLPFTYLHAFSFSSRPGTRAATLPDHFPASVIKKRARQLRALGEAKAAAFRRSQIGRTFRVLTLHRDAEDTRQGLTPALSTNYLRVRVQGPYPPNMWLDVSLSAEESVPASALSAFSVVNS